MSKVEEFIAATRLNDLVNKKEEDKQCKTVLWVLAIVGAVAAIVAIAYAVYCFFTPDYLEDFCGNCLCSILFLYTGLSGGF